MSNERELGIVVYGATGYTGKLVAEYLNKQYGVNGSVSWAIAGRSLEKLEAVRDELALPAELPLLVADASDAAHSEELELHLEPLPCWAGLPEHEWRQRVADLVDIYRR